MAKATFWDVIENTLKKVSKPLSPKDIWDQAHELNTIGDFVSIGKTPWNMRWSSFSAHKTLLNLCQDGKTNKDQNSASEV